jgi:hypothetical protein
MDHSVYKTRFPIEKFWISYRPDHVAEGIVHILREGATGSIWVSNNCQPVYQVDFPELVKP